MSAQISPVTFLHHPAMLRSCQFLRVMNSPFPLFITVHSSCLSDYMIINSIPVFSCLFPLLKAFSSEFIMTTLLGNTPRTYMCRAQVKENSHDLHICPDIHAEWKENES